MKTKMWISGLTLSPAYQYAATRAKRVDDMYSTDIMRWQNERFSVRKCRIHGCLTRLQYDGVTTLRPGSREERRVFVYRCPKCGNAEMFRTVRPQR